MGTCMVWGSSDTVTAEEATRAEVAAVSEASSVTASQLSNNRVMRSASASTLLATVTG